MYRPFAKLCPLAHHATCVRHQASRQSPSRGRCCGMCFGPLIAASSQAISFLPLPASKSPVEVPQRVQRRLASQRQPIQRGHRTTPRRGGLALISQLRIVFDPCSAIAGVMVLSEVECLMMMFGSGASTCATTFGEPTSAETTRSPQPPSRRGHHELREGRLENWFAVELLRHLFVSPLKAGAIYPEAVKENGDLASDCHLRLFHAHPLRQTNAPRLQRRPLLRPVHEHAGRFV